ncbi:MAG TPA: hypothetical protein PLZ68_10615 [Ferruginibacter sp.]|nr:hypothetical protein [Ferruginibacter sp.]
MGNNTFSLYFEKAFYLELKRLYPLSKLIKDEDEIYALLEKEEFSNVLSNWYNNELIDWHKTIKYLEVDYEEWMIELLKNVLKLETIFYSIQDFNFSVPFLVKYKNEIPWDKPFFYRKFHWNRELLLEFRDYLVFTNKPIKNGIIEYASVTRYYLHSFNGGKYKPKEGFITLSECTLIEWSLELINDNLNYWDWDFLSANKSITFTDEIIREFEEYWNWDILSKNMNISWPLKILRDFNDRIDKKAISFNQKIDWYSYILDFDWYNENNENVLDYRILSMNPSFTQFLFDNSGAEYKIVNYYTLMKRVVYSGQKTDKLLFQPCLCVNEQINWTTEFIAKNIQKLDVWLIALRGKISIETVMQYASYFDELRKVFSTSRRFSDFPYFTEDTYYTGWHLLTLNKNFIPDDTFSKFSKTRNVLIHKPDGRGGDIYKWVTVDFIFKMAKNEIVPIKLYSFQSSVSLPTDIL